MQNIIRWFFTTTNIYLVMGLCILYLIFPLYLLPNIINSGQTGPLDLMFWYNHDTLYQMMASYGEVIRSRYMIGLLTVDVAYPIIYGSLLALVIALIIKKLPIACSRKLCLIPFVAVLFDLTENTLVIFLLNSYPQKNYLLADIAGFVTASKWSAFIIIASTVIYIVAKGVMTRRQIQNQ